MDNIRISRGICERLGTHLFISYLALGYHILHPRLPRQKFKFVCLLIANVINYGLTITVAIHGFETVATQGLQ